MDCSVTPIRNGEMSLIHTTDFFYPLVDDPYIMGKIACANVLSDLYAMGVVDCHNMLMLLGVSSKMTEKERDIITPLLIKGFKDAAAEADVKVTGGQTVFNPWTLIGGVASSICFPKEFILPNGAVAGDVLVLTKPIGTQLAVNCYQWLDKPERWSRINSLVSDDDIHKAYLCAMSNMVRLNRNGARLMHKYNAHAATDVTGFGLLGHATNLAQNQKNKVSFVIDTLPIIAKMACIAKVCSSFKLLQGYSPETSGGLLICMPRAEAQEYCKDIERRDGNQAWIIGTVKEGSGTAQIIEDPEIIEVPHKENAKL
ncbi:hypothetical protein AAG570_007936 [Ranatra chinensis]|uniref:Selenide, water dikinase n=1 Tax=Ranatra chinensis TaxID=642074 RepID=A0ABD0YH55_9HEMI